MTEKDKFKPKQSEDNMTVIYDEDDFQNGLPHLARELQGHQTQTIPIHCVKHDRPETEEDIKDDEYFTGKVNVSTDNQHPIQENQPEVKDPDVIDFICKCETDEEAIEIIDYLVSRDELTKELGEEYKKQLNKEGLESFGQYRPRGHYEHEYFRETRENFLD